MQRILEGYRATPLRRPDLLFPERDGIHYQNSPKELKQQILSRKEGQWSDSGVPVIRTGKFTGRSPKDRFIVKDEETKETVHWNEINQPLSPEHFDRLYKRMTRFIEGKELWIRDCYACADPLYRFDFRAISTSPVTGLFCYNMFLRPSADELTGVPGPEWTLIQAPGCLADPSTDGTRQSNFTVIHFGKKIILIGGSAYTGEIKKSIFSVLNYLLPRKGILSMHCSANMGIKGDTALFFGLSGTGKTTLSNDPNRRLIGDDEHGWSDNCIFNFEGGCYAKCIHLSPEKEPQIYEAIREEALLENVSFFEGTRQVNYDDKSITENTRVSYPLFYLNHSVLPSVGRPPRHIFFLTCDAYGVLPPLARLSPEQALYYFITGYTAKIAGTEAGIREPRATFSACYAAPFLPLHPVVYAKMLREKIKKEKVNCWLVNTGWTGGPYGTGNRIPLPYTRLMVSAVLEGALQEAEYCKDPIFELETPLHCPGVRDSLLQVRETWKDPKAYDLQALELAKMFADHFRKIHP